MIRREAQKQTRTQKTKEKTVMVSSDATAVFFVKKSKAHCYAFSSCKTESILCPP